jgi:hypothetical protein
MAQMKNSALNIQADINADGFDLVGGTTARKLTATGADITLTGTGSNTYTYPASTSTLASLTLTETLTNKTLTSPVLSNNVTSGVGSLEYDTVAFYSTRATGERGVATSVQHITLTTAFTTAGGTTALQKLFNAPTNGTLTVAGSTTFYFECYFTLSSMSASTGTFSFGLGGSATFTRTKYFAIADKAALTGITAPVITNATAATATVISGATNTTTTGWAMISGKVVVGTGGTIIPSFATSVANATVVDNDSYFKIWPAGSNTVQSVGNWT